MIMPHYEDFTRTHLINLLDYSRNTSFFFSCGASEAVFLISVLLCPLWGNGEVSRSRREAVLSRSLKSKRSVVGEVSVIAGEASIFAARLEVN